MTARREARPRADVNRLHPGPRRFGKIHDMNFQRGYGFIMDDGHQVLRFFHANSVEDSEFTELTIGMEVSFDPTHTVKGPRALRVRREERGQR